MHGILRGGPARDSLLGATLDGRYRLVSRLGAGGMGVVYEAEHVLIGRRFALKLMHVAPDLSDELFVRFQREAMAAASVGNPHIVEVTDMGVLDDGGAFLVLEYLDGRDLARAVASDGLFSVARAVNVARQLCDALAAVHAKRIVHRDLKPENVMLIEREGVQDFVKVLDFGICKLLETDSGAGITRTNASLGTPQFMAPEQFRGSARVDARADIHAVGAILYYMLTGAPPYEAEDLPMLLLRICTEAPPSARMHRSDVPVELDHVIKRACAKRADDRFQSVDELADALVPYADVTEAPRVSRVARTAREVITPSVERATAPSWPAPGPSEEVMLPMELAWRGRAFRAAIVGALLVAAASALAWRARPEAPVAAHEKVQPAQAASKPAIAARAPEAEPDQPVDAPISTPTAKKKRVQSAPVPSERPATHAEPPPPKEVAPEPAPQSEAPSPARAQSELDRYRYPRRELRDEI